MWREVFVASILLLGLNNKIIPFNYLKIREVGGGGGGGEERYNPRRWKKNGLKS
jgi:hypothetical protein